MILETERLILRPPDLSDAPVIRQLAGHPDIAATTLTMPHPYPAGAAEEFILAAHEREAAGESLTFALVRKTDQQLMGVIILKRIPRFDRTELGYWIGVPYWNQGYMSEAARRLVDYSFADLGVHRVCASYLSHNLASRRVMEKAGMIYEGTLRDHAERFGKFYDLAFCGILRSEWEARQV